MGRIVAGILKLFNIDVNGKTDFAEATAKLGTRFEALQCATSQEFAGTTSGLKRE
jgi:hypothetical protein